MNSGDMKDLELFGARNRPAEDTDKPGLVYLAFSTFI